MDSYSQVEEDMAEDYKNTLLIQHCTMVDGADIAPGREVAVDGSRYGSASTRNVKFTPAHIF